MRFCYYCGAQLIKPLHVTEDHIIPRSRTRATPNRRTVPCCMHCNQEKGALTIEEFRVVRAFRYGYISGVSLQFPGEQRGEQEFFDVDLPRGKK